MNKVDQQRIGKGKPVKIRRNTGNKQKLFVKPKLHWGLQQIKGTTLRTKKNNKKERLVNV